MLFLRKLWYGAEALYWTITHLRVSQSRMYGSYELKATDGLRVWRLHTSPRRTFVESYWLD